MKLNLIVIYIFVYLLISCGLNDQHRDVNHTFDIADFDSIFQQINKVELEINNKNIFFLYNAQFFFLKDKKMVVIDNRGKKVILYSQNGKFIKMIGNIGRGPGELIEPYCGIADSLDNILIYDLAQMIINKYNPDGNFVSTIKLKKYMEKIYISSKQNIFFYTSQYFFDNKIVFKYSPNFDFLNAFALPLNEFKESNIMQCGGIALDQYENSYVISPYNYLIRKYDTNGTPLLYYHINPSFFKETKKMPKEEPHEFKRWIKEATPIVDILLFSNKYLFVTVRDIDKKRNYVDIYLIRGDQIKYCKTVLINHLFFSMHTSQDYFYTLSEDEDKMYLNKYELNIKYLKDCDEKIQ